MIANRTMTGLLRLRLARAAERDGAARAKLRDVICEADQAGMPQREIARVTGLDHSTVSRWLSRSKPPQPPDGQMTIWECLDGDGQDE